MSFPSKNDYVVSYYEKKKFRQNLFLLRQNIKMKKIYYFNDCMIGISIEH